jgi:capsular polysaccharide biosynthesis protein
MLLSKEIAEVANDLKEEAIRRPYVGRLIPAVVHDDSFWRMLLELLEIVLHRRGYVIVKREILERDSVA